ncbi:RNA polymerase II-associated protein 3 [Actinomortierella ambigua]|nr:RNA polymerase II-associated protein 3 [Actinomortierella ambigua]
MERFVEWEKRVKSTSARKPVSNVQERPLARERKDILLGQVTPVALKPRARTADESTKPPTASAASSAEQNRTASPPTLPSSNTKPAEALAAARTSYYDSWDKFDVDKALEAIDQKEGDKPKSSTKKQPTAAPAITPAPATTAVEEKEKGNAAFKKGDYKKAIEHYTAGMKLDPTNPVYPINRAMALLKLERYSEVEADCTTGLKLDPNNVKALWRRGIARRSLGKLTDARVDFETALKIEPANKAVKDELAKLAKTAPEKPKTKTATSSAPKPLATSTSTTTTVTKSQPVASSGIKSSARVPIVEVDSDDDSTLFHKTSRGVSKTSTATAATTATKALPSPPSAAQPKVLEAPSSAPAAVPEPSPTAPASASAPAPAPAPARPTTSESSSPQSSPSPSTTTAIPASAQPTAPSVKMTPPSTLLDFQRDWKSYSRDKNLLYHYLKLIQPQDLPTLFKSSFESDYFSSMLPIYKEFYIPCESANLLYETLRNLASVQRFGMALMFISKSESQMLSELFQHLSASVAQASFTAQDLSSLAAKYKVKLT